MKALLAIDIQNDFLPGGSLAVANGDQVIAFANHLMSQYDLVVATQDWHPPGHQSFASQHPGHDPGDLINLNGLDQILWPDHCIEGTLGAEFAPKLNMDAVDHVIQKGTDCQIDSYSGFFDNARRKTTGLESYLREKQVREVHLVGLATDYCVKFTALDAIDLGFQTAVWTEGVRGVEREKGDCQNALTEMKTAGIKCFEKQVS